MQSFSRSVRASPERDTELEEEGDGRSHTGARQRGRWGPATSGGQPACRPGSPPRPRLGHGEGRRGSDPAGMLGQEAERREGPSHTWSSSLNCGTNAWRDKCAIAQRPAVHHRDAPSSSLTSPRPTERGRAFPPPDPHPRPPPAGALCAASVRLPSCARRALTGHVRPLSWKRPFSTEAWEWPAGQDELGSRVRAESAPLLCSRFCQTSVPGAPRPVSGSHGDGPRFPGLVRDFPTARPRPRRLLRLARTRAGQRSDVRGGWQKDTGWRGVRGEARRPAERGRRRAPQAPRSLNRKRTSHLHCVSVLQWEEPAGRFPGVAGGHGAEEETAMLRLCGNLYSQIDAS